MTTTYAGYSYGLDGYILKVTAEDAAGTPGLALTGLPDDTRALVAETVELVMKGLGLARFNRRMPGTIVRYERMDPADPRPENLDRFELRSLGGATTLAVIAEHQQELQIKTEGRTLGPEHLTATVIAANILPELTHIWDSKMISTRGIAGIAHAASQAGLRILTATANGPVAENVHPFPRSVSAETLSDAVTILTGEAPPGRPVEKETWETQKTRSREHQLDGERDTTPEQLRILEIAVTGRHNLCITTPERSITTSRYAAIASDLMPELGWTESAEATRIHSAALLPAPHERRVRHAPMRAPHFTTSLGGMTGSTSAPGELALCHHGILYLDDPAELQTDVVIAIRAAAAQEAVFHADPRNKVRITRHPSRFMLIVADPLGDTGTRSAGHQKLIECCEIRMNASSRATGQRARLSEAARRVQRARVRLKQANADHRPTPDRTEAAPDQDAIARTIAALDGADTVSEKHQEDAETISAMTQHPQNDKR